MPRYLTVLIALGLLLAACQLSASPDATSPIEVVPSTTQPEPDGGHDLIVVSTIDGAIAVHDATGAEISRIDPPQGNVFRQPTWLDDATIVFSEVSETGDHSLTAIDAESVDVVWRSAMETPPFYFSPAPAGGIHATTSLRNDPSGAGLIAELIDHAGNASALSDESPLYTSWSPTGESLAIHIVGRRLDIWSQDGTETVTSGAALFQTPVWVDMGLVTLRVEDESQRLTVWDDGSFTDLANVDGPVGFVASGDLVAVQATERPDAGSIAAGLRTQAIPTIPGGKLVVLDGSTGTLHTVSNELALLYQWSQSGESLLYATLADEPLSLEWHIWSIAETSTTDSFVLQPPWFQNLVPFFDQYAQSVQLWSSSGDYIGYPAVVDAEPVVVIEPIDGSEPTIISGATWAAWAPSG